MDPTFKNDISYDQNDSGLILAYTWYSNDVMDWRKTLDELTPYYLAIYNSNAFVRNASELPIKLQTSEPGQSTVCIFNSEDFKNETAVTISKYENEYVKKFTLPVQPLLYTKSYDYIQNKNNYKWDNHTFNTNTLNNNPFPYFINLTDGLNKILSDDKMIEHEINSAFFTDPYGYYDILQNKNNASTCIHMMYLNKLSDTIYSNNSNYLNIKNPRFYYCAMNYIRDEIETDNNITDSVLFYDNWNKKNGSNSNTDNIADFLKNNINDSYATNLYLYKKNIKKMI